MKRFYRYIIFRLYGWALSKKSFSPIFDVTGTIAVVHMLQLLVIYMLIITTIPGIPPFHENKSLVIGFGIFMLVIHYFLLYNKERWGGIMEEFMEENPAEKSRGRWRVLGYLIGSPILCIILMIIIGSIGNLLEVR